MKNKIYILGIFSGMVTACGCLFKIMHWPFAGTIIFVGIVSLSLVFLPLAIASMVQVEKNKRLRIFYILLAIVMAFNFIGALFKIMHWPGAGIFLMIGIPLPFVVLLPAYLWSNPSDQEVNYKNLLAMMFFFAYFAAITSFLALRISSNVVDGFVRSAIQVNDKTVILKENVEHAAAFSNFSNPVNDEADKLCRKINEVKHMVLQKDLDTTSMRATFLDKKPLIEMQYLAELHTEMNNFRIMVQKQHGADSKICKYVEETFAGYFDPSDGDGWENVWMSNQIIASAIEGLNLLEFRVRLVGMESYNNLKK